MRHMVGMIVVGAILYLSWSDLGQYYVEGVGYATIIDILSGTLSQFPLLLLLYALKLFNTSLTLGSGGSGGIFSPSLYLGATIGGMYGILARQIFPGLEISPPAFAVVGMAGMVGGATGAVMAAIVMIFEMTLDYNVIVPMTITVAFSYGVRKWLSRESIYTLKLVRRVHYMSEALQVNFHQVITARDIMETRHLTVPSFISLHEFAGVVSYNPGLPFFLVTAPSQKILGIVPPEAMLGAVKTTEETIRLEEVAERNFIVVEEKATLFDIIAQMRKHQVSIALVADDSQVIRADQVKGIITPHQIGKAMGKSFELFSD